jgi:transposase
VWENLLERLIDEPDFEWLMIDASHCKVTPPRERGQGREPRNGAHKRGLNSKIQLAVDAHGMPVRVAVTAGTQADCTEAAALIDGIVAEYLLADRGYDTNESIDKAIASGCEIVIPPKKNAKCNESMTRIFIASVIWQRMPSRTSNGGGASRQGMQRLSVLLSPPSRPGASCFGLRC